MKSKKKHNIVRVLFLLVLFFVGNYYLANPINSKVSREINSYTLTNVDILGTSGHWDLAPFVIDDSGGGDYTWEEASAETWCSGSGTFDDPYLIENVTIDGGNSGSCFTIKNSDKYFRIENCTVFNSGSVDFDAGIHLDYVENGTLINNNCSFNNRYGMFVTYSDNTTVLGNTANNNQNEGIWFHASYNTTVLGNTANNNRNNGIRISGSDNNTVSGNTANNNSFDGIHFYYSDNNNISGNIVDNNDRKGIYIFLSNNNTVLDNIAKNNTDGLYFSDSNFTVVSGNHFKDNYNYGVRIFDSDSQYNIFYKNLLLGNIEHAIDNGLNNNWNNSVIGNYWDNYTGIDADKNGIGDTPHNFGTGTDYLPIWNFQSPIHIDDSPASPIDWAWAETQPWCSGSGTFSAPYVIDGLNITARGVGNGILIENSNKYFIVRNCKLIESGAGSYDAGIRLDHAGNGTLINNNCSFNNNYGIYLDYSDNTTVSGNTANNNQGYGIYLRYSDNNTVSGNTANNNTIYGIYIDISDNTTISGNTVNYGSFGIRFYLSHSATVSGNIVDNIVNYGIYTRESDYNLIYKNYFNDNNVNAFDNGTANKWDNGVIGNYWDDYAGVDANDDGIGDTPYIILGTAGSQDNFPIWTDGDDINAPVITIILPIADSVFGLVAPNYQITIVELNLDTIWYTLDGGTTNYTITGLTGTFNQLAWEALSEGSVTIRFYANDSAGNIGFTDVEVIIEIPEDLDDLPIISFGNYYILFSFVTILSFIILEKRKKK